MKSLILAAGIALGSFAPAFANSDDIQTTIQGQLDAFQMDNFDQAFTFASPMVQNIFGSSARFGIMVRQGYPMVWRPENVKFLDLSTIGEYQRQLVQIRDGQGRFHVLEYRMININDAWLINGVSLVPAPQAGA